jgi:hypothetical protein
VEPVKKFLKLGDSLLNRHVLFDVLPDDLATPESLTAYRAVYRVGEKEPKPVNRFEIEAPATVRASLSQPAKGKSLHLHLVNYNRTEPKKPKSAGRGIQDEKPIQAENIRITFRLPEGADLKQVNFLTPENNLKIVLQATRLDSGKFQITIPPFLVYAVLELAIPVNPKTQTP